MFNVGGGEVLVILLVALVVLGPDKLPGAVRKVGQVVSEVRKISAGFQAEMRTAMLDEDASRRIGGGDPPPPTTERPDDDPWSRLDTDRPE
ncbi:Sec-independent protein translocase protein TatB [Actinomarinicola tropica]|uniref:Twin-arginine translocase subunit TatB n=1 Tax=Actinomarinicola tropica TaxID=2789776 RepID=A0A5Q2RLH5_9ACTN|nr:Sec-independent protein translocase protein TatB [Actinomarinicola tropica]QGG95286.1 twin-arginine translocase subunit TatB [Actinomarinicola tropica]